MKHTSAELQAQYRNWRLRYVTSDDLLDRIICRFNLWRLRLKIGDVQTTEDDRW